MTEPTAKIVAHSISPDGVELISYQLRYPKFIHGELMTHRVFSRNASSSRAIPVEKLLAVTLQDAYVPLFRKNQAGMQPGELLDERVQEEAEQVWMLMAEQCAAGVKKLADLGVHKQWANRPLEWFGWINVLVTSTEWSNFFALRLDRREDGWPTAQDEMYILAREMARAKLESTPKMLHPGEWHLPYVLDVEAYTLDQQIRCSVARAARVSYLTTDMREPSLGEDLKLYDRLLGNKPIHASPAEHQATPDHILFHGPGKGHWAQESLHGNFNGWVQYRKTLPNETA